MLPYRSVASDKLSLCVFGTYRFLNCAILSTTFVSYMNRNAHQN